MWPDLAVISTMPSQVHGDRHARTCTLLTCITYARLSVIAAFVLVVDLIGDSGVD